MKKVVTKADIRDSLQQETDRFLRQGGLVEEVPRGISGKDPGDSPVFLNRSLFVEPKGTRTPVPEVIAAIEAKRKARFTRNAPRKGRLARTRRKTTIYDDFGEPLRRVWTDD